MNMKEIRELAETLISQHLDSNLWEFEWISSSHSCGRCKYNLTPDRRILLAGGKIQVNTDYAIYGELEEIKNTILHEIAHAIAGPHANHGYHWKSACYRIGAKPERLHHHSHASEMMAFVNAKYRAVCPTCKHIHYIARMPKRIKLCATSSCKEQPTHSRQLTWVKNI